jgi:hypothetical protein
MDILITLPLRPDGVRGTLEFVFAVHPSTLSSGSGAESPVPQKSGANITNEAITLATRILTHPPPKISPQTWFSAIAPQLFSLLDGKEQELLKVAVHIIAFGILGRKQFGAPGRPSPFVVDDNQA